MQRGRLLTILVDADDVMLDLVPHWTKWLNVRHGTSVKPEDITEWELSQFFPKLREDEIFAPLLEPGFWATIPARDGAAETCEMLRRDGHALYVVTATDPRNAGMKFDRMRKLFPFLNSQHFIVASDKAMIKGDILIDDYAPNLLDGSFHKFLMTRPHNARFRTELSEIVRVDDWNEVYPLCCGVSLFTKN